MMLGLGAESGGWGRGRLTIPLGTTPTAEDEAKCAEISGHWVDWMEFTQCERPSDPATYWPPYTGPVVGAGPSYGPLGPEGQEIVLRQQLAYAAETAARESAETARRAALCGSGNTYQDPGYAIGHVRADTQELEDQWERKTFCRSNIVTSLGGGGVIVAVAAVVVVLMLMGGSK